MLQRQMLDYLRNTLKTGDQAAIARELGVSRVWVCLVLNGKGVSAPVIGEAERIIESRKNQSHETANC